MIALVVVVADRSFFNGFWVVVLTGMVFIDSGVADMVALVMVVFVSVVVVDIVVFCGIVMAVIKNVLVVVDVVMLMAEASVVTGVFVSVVFGAVGAVDVVFAFWDAAVADVTAEMAALDLVLKSFSVVVVPCWWSAVMSSTLLVAVVFV